MQEEQGTVAGAEAETEQTEPLEPTAEAERRERLPEHGCPVKTWYDKPCDRPIYQAPPGVDQQPVCLMHSKDPNKSDAEFQAIFEQIVEKAGDGETDFTGFVFPGAPYVGRKFSASCCFAGATFTQEADFGSARFTQDAYFYGAAFAQDADFSGATFTRGATFSRATFTERADFSGGARFAREAYFYGAAFTRDADFIGATFTQDATFSRARFTQHADFRWATFTQAADFSAATFTQAANFRGATFKGPARFEPGFAAEGERPLRFEAAVRFSAARFEDYADFRGPLFGSGPSPTARPVFSFARFDKPERVTFHNCWLGHTLFVNCDVSKVNFSDVEWGCRGKRVRLYEEDVPLNEPDAWPLEPREGEHKRRNYRLMAEVYHQLKVNYDSKGDPWTAGEFHYGEMEMKRRWSRWQKPVLRWLGQNFALTALYR